MRVFQVIENIVSGDAISNHTVNIYKILKKNDYETAIYAVQHDVSLDQNMVFSIEQLPELNEDDLIIYQMCQKSVLNMMITGWKCKKACMYHNITPAEFFAPYDIFQPVFQERGLKEIEKLHGVFDYIWGDSHFNCRDLIAMGYDEKKTSVLPILLVFDDFHKKPDERTVKKYSDGWVNLLFVGRISPNKKQEDIIRIFTYYKKYYNPKSRLILIGSFFNIVYQQCLEKYVQSLEVEDVIFPGHISFQQILAFYKTADVFVCMSEHEGFCVPLLEAMLFDVPILAYEKTAVPETLGDSGILVQDKNPAKASFIIDQLVQNKQLREEIICKQQKRLEDFSYEKTSKAFLEEMERISQE